MTDRDILPIDPTPADDAVIAARVAALYASTPPADEAQVERCIQAVRSRSQSPAQLTPPARRFSVVGSRWWWGAAAAAVLVTATTRPWRGLASTSEADSALVQAVSAVTLQGSVTPLADSDVRFDLQLPTAAKEVVLVGDFNGWDRKATPMVRRDDDGTWSAKVPLGPGRHMYAFVVDGTRWIVDPLAPQVPDDGYGPSNAVVIDRGPK